MNKPWKVVLAFVGVFLAGAICGGPFAVRWFRLDRFGARPPVRLQIMQRLEDELDLTDPQKEKISPIVQHAQEEMQRQRREHVKMMAAVLEQMHAEVAAELTPDQKTKLDGMRTRLRERAERVRSEFRDRDRPPPPPGK